MDSKKLKELFQQLTPEEKIAQTIQLNGSLVIENEVMTTGPMQDLGLPPNLKIHEIGSIYNVNVHQTLIQLQRETLAHS